MNLDQCKKEKKTVLKSVKITPKMEQFIISENISFSKMVEVCLVELMKEKGERK